MTLLLLIPFLLIELYLSLKVGESIGFLWSVIWIISTLFIGLRLLNMSPHTVSSQMNMVGRGKLKIDKFKQSSMAYLFGSLFLMIPGVFSDLIGVSLLFYTLYLQFVAKITPEQTNNYKKEGDNDVIDVEIID